MGTTKEETLVVLDNTVLTNFGLVGRPDIIYDLWQAAAHTTRAVLAEYLAGVGTANLQAEAWAGLPVLDLTLSESLSSLLCPG